MIIIIGSLVEAWHKNRDFKSLAGQVETGEETPLLVTGLEGSQKVLLMAALFQKAERPLFIVAPDMMQAGKTCDDLRTLLPETAVTQIPGREFSPGGVIGQSREITGERIKALAELSRGCRGIWVTTPETLPERLMPRQQWLKHSVKLVTDREVNREALLCTLAGYGYQRVPLIEVPGQFSVRGDVIDIFPPGQEQPLRLTLFGDEVESLRFFDLLTQRSGKALPEAFIYPAGEVILTAEVKARGLADIKSSLQESIKKLLTKGERQAASGLSAEINKQVSVMENSAVLPEHLHSYFPYFYHTGENWFDYFPPSGVVCLDDPARIMEAANLSYERINGIQADLILKNQRLGTELSPVREADRLWEGTESGLREKKGKKELSRPVILFSLFQNPGGNLAPRKIINLAARSSPRFYGQTELWKNELLHWDREGYRVYVLTSSPERGRAFLQQLSGEEHFGAEKDYPAENECLTENGCPAERSYLSDEDYDSDEDYGSEEDYGLAEDYGSEEHHGISPEDCGPEKEPPADEDTLSSRYLQAAAPVFIKGSLHNGFIIPALKMVVLTEDLFTPVRKKKLRKERVAEEARIRHYRDLIPGDYVVHESHGIGKYLGLETLQVDGSRRDFLHISYGGNDSLYIPADQTGCVQKYVGVEGRPPKLHRLSTGTWHKTKARVRSAVQDMARELIEINAAREAARGHAYTPHPDFQSRFAGYFPYEETPDQARSVREVLDDLARERPMDRLLCGDVGFGKTEVVMRAAFNVMNEGKQVAILVPTTILAQQHYRTFKERFAPFSGRVEQVSRFLSPARQKAIIRDMAAGKVDIVVGTHRLLSKDVQFKDLGLVVIDEEHRFGVRHKERLKKLRVNVDILSLTATPIPRTLHMSMAGVRDLSLIETPPENRYPVQTYVVEYSDGLIREAINRELARGGQVFFVYNRVEHIEKWSRHLAELVPAARIKAAHGQMPEALLESIMKGFMEGEFDVLVSTTIIEAGLDMPNVNTLIIFDADRFGLAQLYQLRGRVGRSSRLAYAYLTFRRDRVLTNSAEKRLQAVKEFAELGSGFKVAMRDLEIRGAGNILGPEQHGFIAEVGFDLYCRLLEDAVKDMRGEKKEEKHVPRLDLKVDAYLPGEYISDPERKIELYQRVYAADTLEEVALIGEEMADRFGPPPGEAQNLLGVARIKVLSGDLQVSSINRENGEVVIRFNGNHKLNPSCLLNAVRKYPVRLSRSAGGTLSLKLAGGQGNNITAVENLLNIAKSIEI